MTITAESTIIETLDRETQDRLVIHVRDVADASPFVRPRARGGQAMSVRVTSAGTLGWGGDEADYRYLPRDPHGNPWPPIPELWREIADRVAGPHAWDCAIVNWYGAGSSLGFHQDLGERDHTQPIVTISIGDTAVWAVRTDVDSPVTRARLESGSVTLLAGRSRMVLHSIERLIPAPLFSPLQCPGRVSITLRVAG
jgi:alkylated DNA repair protein (DNA oxidative demethylase)